MVPEKAVPDIWKTDDRIMGNYLRDMLGINPITMREAPKGVNRL